MKRRANIEAQRRMHGVDEAERRLAGREPEKLAGALGQVDDRMVIVDDDATAAHSSRAGSGESRRRHRGAAPGSPPSPERHARCAAGSIAASGLVRERICAR